MKFKRRTGMHASRCDRRRTPKRPSHRSRRSRCNHASGSRSRLRVECRQLVLRVARARSLLPATSTRAPTALFHGRAAWSRLPSPPQRANGSAAIPRHRSRRAPADRGGRDQRSRPAVLLAAITAAPSSTRSRVYGPLRLARRVSRSRAAPRTGPPARARSSAAQTGRSRRRPPRSARCRARPAAA
jgi:hypothetical protein